MALASYGALHTYLAPLFEVVGTDVYGSLTASHAEDAADLARQTGWDFGPARCLGVDPTGLMPCRLPAGTDRTSFHCSTENAIAETRLRDLRLAGGIALNCIAGDKISRPPSAARFRPEPGSRLRGIRVARAHTNCPAARSPPTPLAAPAATSRSNRPCTAPRAPDGSNVVAPLTAGGASPRSPSPTPR